MRRTPIFAASLCAFVVAGCLLTPPRTQRLPVAAGPAVASVPSPPPKPAAPSASDRAQLRALQARMDQQARELVAFWKAHGPDATDGGFHGTLSREGRPIAPTDKGIIQQTRHLWTFSAWYARREPTAEIKAIADRLYRFLVDHLRDPEAGEFFWKVSKTGQVNDRKKLLYAQSFAIYALSQYAGTFGSAEARAYALACFGSIDRRAHDLTFMGYDQSQDPGFFSPGTQKETNTHIHLLEAFTALYRVTQDPLVKARLNELVEVTARKIVQPEGYARKEFRRDFTPLGEPVVSYGHDIETSWLLLDALDALDALGRTSDRALVDIALRLGEYSARAGFDNQLGGYFEEGVPGGAPTKVEKIWWIQAEALSGLFKLYERSHDPAQLMRLEKTLTFIEQHQRDREYGEWYWGVLADGSVGPHGANKGEEWKASYHNVRALLFTSDWIGRALAKGGSAP